MIKKNISPKPFYDHSYSKWGLGTPLSSQIGSIPWAPQHLSCWKRRNLQENGYWLLVLFVWKRGGGGNTKDVLLKDYLPSGNVINEQYYGDLLTGYRKAFSRKQEIADIHLLQDNTSSCEVQLMTNDMNVQTPIPGIFSWFGSITLSFSPNLKTAQRRSFLVKKLGYSVHKVLLSQSGMAKVCQGINRMSNFS